MLRQLLIGSRDGVATVIEEASTPDEIKKLLEVRRKAATEGSYNDFDYLEIWTRSTGVSQVQRLKRKPKSAPAPKQAGEKKGERRKDD